MNDSRTDRSTCAESVPAVSRGPGADRWEVIDKTGHRITQGPWSCTDCDATFARLHPSGRCGCGSGRVMSTEWFKSAEGAAEFAKTAWPHLEQDPDRSGAGWDVQVAGVK